MNVRKKLIELLDNHGDDLAFCDICDRPTDDCEACKNEQLADYLLDNGVIVPPCKVGDTVYMPWNYNDAEGVAILTVTHVVIDSLHSYVKTDLWSDDEEYLNTYNRGRFDFDDFGETVFLTKAEAEKALAEKYGGAENGKEST